MLASLPAFAWMIVSAALWRRIGSIRKSILYALAIVGAAIVFITEVLSAFHAINRPAVVAAWCGMLITAFIFFTLQPKRDVRELREQIRFVRWDVLSGACALLAMLIITGVVVSALSGAPNTWDSMQYHLPRIVQWSTFHSLSLYATPDYQQLFAPPFAEYVMLHLFLLLPGDAAVSLTQWAAWVGCAIGASLVAQFLKGGRTAQALAAVLVLVLPNAILAASGPKNDCVVALWLVLTICLVLEYRQRPSIKTAVGLGTVIGLAVLTKGTALVYIPCFFALLVPVFSRSNLRVLTVHTGVLAALVLLINAPQFTRNIRLSGSPLGFPAPDNAGLHVWRNSIITPSILIDNVVRNLACHIAVHNAPMNDRVQAVISNSLRKISIDPNDPASTWYGDQFRIFYPRRHEIFQGNPLCLALFLVTFSIALVRHKQDSSGLLLPYFGAVIGGFVLFCAILRYQSWNARLHLPLFIVACSPIAVILSRQAKRTLIEAGCLCLLVVALPNAFMNDLRPLVRRSGPHATVWREPRSKVYFYDQHESESDSYIKAVEKVKKTHCNFIGIDASGEHFEYPLFALLCAGLGPREVRYTGVTNLTERFESPHPEFCAVICPRCRSDKATLRRYEDRHLKDIGDDNVDVFVAR